MRDAFEMPKGMLNLTQPLHTLLLSPVCRCPRADNILTCAVAEDAHEEQSAAEAWQAVGGETVIGRCGRGLDSWGVFKQNRSLSKKPINQN